MFDVIRFRFFFAWRDRGRLSACPLSASVSREFRLLPRLRRSRGVPVAFEISESRSDTSSKLPVRIFFFIIDIVFFTSCFDMTLPFLVFGWPSLKRLASVCSALSFLSNALPWSWSDFNLVMTSCTGARSSGGTVPPVIAFCNSLMGLLSRL